MKFSKLMMSLLVIMFFATVQTIPAKAEYSPWMKISKIESYGKTLKRRKLVPDRI